MGDVSAIHVVYAHSFSRQEAIGKLMTTRTGSAYMTEHIYNMDFVLSSLFVGVFVTQLRPVKNHSANVLSESQVMFSLIFPLLVAAWKRRKSFMVARSGASTCFRRMRSRTAASEETGNPFWGFAHCAASEPAVSFASPKLHDPGPRCSRRAVVERKEHLDESAQMTPKIDTGGLRSMKAVRTRC